MLKMLSTALIVMLTLVIIIIGYLGFKAHQSRTQTPEVGLLNGQLLPCPDRPSCVSTFATDPEHQIDPLNGDPTAFSALVADLADTSEATLITQNPNYGHFTFQSGLFGFVDDVELLRIGNQIHLRSVSRQGYSDLGANRQTLPIYRRAFG